MDFFRTACRYLTRDKAFSLINVFGLAVGLTAVLCISFYVVRELNFDRFHQHADRIYRVSINLSGEGIEQETYYFTPPIGPAMKAEVPEIEEYTRITLYNSFIAACNDQSFKLTNVSHADSAFLDLFSFPLVRGNSQTALVAPFSIILTEKIAHKIFGDSDPVGQTIHLDIHDYTITGVVKSPPANSHIQFDALISFSTLYRLPNMYLDWNGGNRYITYLRLKQQADLELANAKMQHILWERLGKDYATIGWKVSGTLHPLPDLHLYHDNGSASMRTGVFIFSALALITFIIACINFVNLTTARSMRRLREASIRKALGAKRFNLIKQFLGESLMIATVAFVLSLILFVLIKPVYIQLAGEMPDGSLITQSIVLVFILTVITGVIGGSYPAIRLSSLNLSLTVKSGETAKNKYWLQNMLIITQFASAAFLIVCTIAASQQLSLMRNMDLGINKEGVLVLDFNGEAAAERGELLKQRLQSLPEISSVTAMSEIPCGGLETNGYRPEGMENPVIINVAETDEDFLDVYGIELLSGRFFSGGVQDKSFYVVNETLAKTFGWNDETIGKTIERDGKHEIIGVVRDFNYDMLYSEIEPLIISNNPEGGTFSSLSIKYNTTAVSAFVSKVEKIWNEVNPDIPYEYAFFDEMYDSLYKMEMTFRTLFAVFAGIAILLATLGALSLMAYTIEQRKNEIGIRKVFGASVRDILLLLLRKTAVQVFVANILACPLAWWIVQNQLSDFAYRISLGPVIFITTFLISALTAMLAVGFQVLKAAMENPVKSIKVE